MVPIVPIVSKLDLYFPVTISCRDRFYFNVVGHHNLWHRQHSGLAIPYYKGASLIVVAFYSLKW